MVESRTAKSLKNSVVALLFYFINLGLQFFSRKIFLEHLGAEVLGLNTTATNLLQFLNLAELGVGAAIGYSLYKPLAEKNRQQINEIVSVQGYLYYKIGLFVGGIAVLLMCFFPWIFSKAEVPAWYTYTTFIVLLIAALSGYFFNYKQIVLTSDQKNYKLNYVVQGIIFSHYTENQAVVFSQNCKFCRIPIKSDRCICFYFFNSCCNLW